MNKKLLFVFGLGLLVLIGMFFLLQTNNEPKKQKQSSEDGQGDKMSTNDSLYPLGDPQTFIDGSQTSFFANEEKKDFKEFLDGLRSGKFNFVWEVWALRRKCPADYSASQCDKMVLSYIETNYSGGDKEEMKELFTSYFSYEDAVRKFEISPDLSFEDRYEIVKNKRREVLGEDKAALFFGMEEAQVSFIEAQRNFVETSKEMKPDERVKKYEELRKKVYGQFHDSVLQREDKYDHYTTEVELREKEIKNLPEEEKEKKLQALELKYFGKENAALIAKARQEEKENQKKIDDHQKKEKEFLQSNPNLSEKEREEKLMKLRIDSFGQEEAEAYTRRLEFEKLSK